MRHSANSALLPAAGHSVHRDDLLVSSGYGTCARNCLLLRQLARLQRPEPPYIGRDAPELRDLANYHRPSNTISVTSMRWNAGMKPS
jgi:hypothetical protein